MTKVPKNNTGRKRVEYTFTYIGDTLETRPVDNHSTKYIEGSFYKVRTKNEPDNPQIYQTLNELLNEMARKGKIEPGRDITIIVKQ